MAWPDPHRRAGRKETSLSLVAREVGRLYHPAGEAARARNAMLSPLTADDLYDKVARLHAGAR
ncbi:hypothetical protein ACFQ2B_15085 [Streptomyces stramineus]